MSVKLKCTESCMNITERLNLSLLEQKFYKRTRLSWPFLDTILPPFEEELIIKILGNIQNLKLII